MTLLGQYILPTLPIFISTKESYKQNQKAYVDSEQYMTMKNPFHKRLKYFFTTKLFLRNKVWKLF